jgi:hypothetical protein
MVRDFFRSLYALGFLLRHVRELPTPEEQKKLGINPTPQMPYPPFFGRQGRH